MHFSPSIYNILLFNLSNCILDLKAVKIIMRLKESFQVLQIVMSKFSICLYTHGQVLLL
jgi:hypothetical protein